MTEESEEEKKAAALGRRVLVLARDWRRLWRIYLVLGLVVLGSVLLGLGGPEFADRAMHGQPGKAFVGPGSEAWWGTDGLGRSNFARVMIGMGGTGVVAILVCMLSFMMGTAAGILRGVMPGAFVPVLAVFYRAWFCYPLFIVAAFLAALSAGNRWQLIFWLGLVGAVMVSRRVMKMMAMVGEHTSFKAAKACGVPRGRLWLNYLLGPATYAGYRASYAVLSPVLLWEASLGFISAEAAVLPTGLGAIMREGREYFLDAPWLVTFPGGALLLMIFVAEACDVAIGVRFARKTAVLEDE